MEPRVAMIAYSTFGQPRGERSDQMSEAVKILDRRGESPGRGEPGEVERKHLSVRRRAPGTDEQACVGGLRKLLGGGRTDPGGAACHHDRRHASPPDVVATLAPP